jgi:hypothetical protein
MSSAIEEIKTSSDVSFGKHIVDAFVQGLEEIVAVFQNSQNSVLKQEKTIEESKVEAQFH